MTGKGQDRTVWPGRGFFACEECIDNSQMDLHDCPGRLWTAIDLRSLDIIRFHAALHMESIRVRTCSFRGPGKSMVVLLYLSESVLAFPDSASSLSFLYLSTVL